MGVHPPVIDEIGYHPVHPPVKSKKLIIIIKYMFDFIFLTAAVKRQLKIDTYASKFLAIFVLFVSVYAVHQRVRK